MKSSSDSSQSSDSKEKLLSSNDRTNISAPPSLGGKVHPLPSPRFPKAGEIWKGRDLDGITEYEIIIIEVGPNSVTYGFAREDSSFVSRHTCSLSIFLALYSRKWKEPLPCDPTSESKTSWLRLPPFFSALATLWRRMKHAARPRFS